MQGAEIPRGRGQRGFKRRAGLPPGVRVVFDPARSLGGGFPRSPFMQRTSREGASARGRPPLACTWTRGAQISPCRIRVRREGEPGAP